MEVFQTLADSYANVNDAGNIGMPWDNVTLLKTYQVKVQPYVVKIRIFS